MVQVEELKEFCYFTDVEYKQILGSVKTRWLSHQPAITRPTFMLYLEKWSKNPPIGYVSLDTT
jgi:hypothetical protein